MDNDSSCQLAQAQLHYCTNQCCQPVTNIAPANKSALASSFSLPPACLAAPFPAWLPGLGCTALTPSQTPTWKKLLHRRCQLPIWQKPTLITKDKQQEWSLPLGFQQWKLWPVLPAPAMKALSRPPSCAEPGVFSLQLRMLRVSAQPVRKRKGQQWVFFTINRKHFLPREPVPTDGNTYLWTARFGCFTLKLN